MIKVIVFDLGGVLFTPGSDIFLTKLHEQIKTPMKKIDEVFQSHFHQEGSLYRKGLMTKQEFWKHASEKLDFDKKLIPKFELMWHDSYKEKPEMEDIILKLKPKFKIIAFSGNIKERFTFLRKKYNLDHLFDDYIMSFDCGTTKGEELFFQIMEEKIGVEPEEAIIIDDKIDNIKIAKEMGFNTIHFKNFKQFQKELDNLLY